MANIEKNQIESESEKFDFIKRKRYEKNNKNDNNGGFMCKYLIKIICICLFAVFLFNISSCKEPAKEVLEPTDSIVTDGVQYTPYNKIKLYRDDEGNCSVEIKDEDRVYYTTDHLQYGEVAADGYPMQFETVEDYRKLINGDSIPWYEMRCLCSFLRDEQGRTPICDPDNIYAPVLPEGYLHFNFVIHGDIYQYVVSEGNYPSDISKTFSELVVATKKVIFIKFFDKEAYQVKVDRCDLVEERDGTFLYYEKSGNTFNDGHNRKALMKKDNVYYEIEYYNGNGVPDRVNVDWFFSFGIEKYESAQQ